MNSRMLRPVLFLLTAVLLATPGVAATSTFYAVLANETTGGNVTVETDLQISSTVGVPLTFTVKFIETNTDGTIRDENEVLPEMTVTPFQTLIFRNLTGGATSGMLEIQADDRLLAKVMVIPVKDGVRGDGAQVPIVNSSNLLQANSTAHLQGLVKDADRVSSLTVVNLGTTSSQCTYGITRPGGGDVVANTVLTHLPFSQAFFPDVLGVVGENNVNKVRVSVRCTAPFYISGMILNERTGDASTIYASQTGTSLLRPPGQEIPCPATALCFDEEGIFHVPSPGNEIYKRNYPLPSGQTYKIFRYRVTFQHGGWWPRNSSGLHNIAWGYFGQWRSSTVMYVNFLGPGQNVFRSNNNMGLPAGVTNRKDVGAALSVGQTYVLEYSYNTNSGSINASVSLLDGTLIKALSHATTVNNINPGGDPLSIWNGLHEEFNEVPTHGWVYSNARAELDR